MEWKKEEEGRDRDDNARRMITVARATTIATWTTAATTNGRKTERETERMINHPAMRRELPEPLVLRACP